MFATEKMNKNKNKISMVPGIRRGPWIKQSYRSQQISVDPGEVGGAVEEQLTAGIEYIHVLECLELMYPIFGRETPPHIRQYDIHLYSEPFRAFQSLSEPTSQAAGFLLPAGGPWMTADVLVVQVHVLYGVHNKGSASTTALGIEVDHSGSCRSGIRSTGVESAREVSVEFAGQSFSQSAPPAGQPWKIIDARNETELPQPKRQPERRHFSSH
ncbi:predicted protein [Histoplasma capsulatum var. duboisii H88]|uniref:Predicted protein n=1 Tax=Ajellomyces capsulatus (strain H88) TaxID=544711 RepID=F0UHM6_AJEC8|nr:predicted protein [Histoplasma capsulatum var. duboisii H88]